MRIILAEDDDLVARGLTEAFQRAGYSVDRVADGEAAEAAIRETSYDIAVLDLGLPRLDGVELIRRIRRSLSALPILVLSARSALDDRVSTLDIGADDYLVKPFQLSEVMARLRVLVRRSQSVTSSRLVLGRLALDLGRATAELDGQSLALTRREWAILEALILARPKVCPKRKLVESLGTWDNEITPNAIEIYVSRLRTKLRDSGVEVITVRGLGYRLDCSDD